jgi:hypothetical protein
MAETSIVVAGEKSRYLVAELTVIGETCWNKEQLYHRVVHQNKTKEGTTNWDNTKLNIFRTNSASSGVQKWIKKIL